MFKFYLIGLKAFVHYGIALLEKVLVIVGREVGWRSFRILSDQEVVCCQDGCPERLVIMVLAEGAARRKQQNRQ
jgi:hypothetical protein